MKKPTKPKPEEFGRQLLWHICGLRSETRIMLQMFSRQIEPDIKKADEIYVGWVKAALKIQRKHYREALDKAGIPTSEDQDLESSGD